MADFVKSFTKVKKKRVNLLTRFLLPAQAPEVIKLFSCSTEQGIYPAYKC